MKGGCGTESLSMYKSVLNLGPEFSEHCMVDGLNTEETFTRRSIYTSVYANWGWKTQLGNWSIYLYFVNIILDLSLESAV